MVAGEISHRELGRVIVNVRRNSSRVSARWKSGLVSLNVPQGTPVADINRILDDFTPRLLAARPALHFHIGQRIVLPGVTFELRSQTVAPDRILARPTLPVTYVEIGRDFDLSDPDVTLHVNDILLRAARRLAPDLLLPHARRLASLTGHSPVAWRISAGHRTLGVCNARGIISLSYILIFLPADLRDFVILHELAHLLEMNHSPRFHALLDSYLGGTEAELTARLRTYRWPVLRR